MESKGIDEIIDDFNTVVSFLAKRDIKMLSLDELYNNFSIEQADLLIILGNSIPFIAEEGARAYKNKIAKKIMIAGGIGHSTKYLIENICNSDKYKDVETDDRPEADILKDVIVRHENIEDGSIIIENISTNCGANAYEALKTIKEIGETPRSVILLQDPTMQRRTHASFKKEWVMNNKKTIFISYAPFVPLIEKCGESFDYINRKIYGLWDIDRFIALVMGEIPRLKDDENGYGPKGRGYITHMDIPDEVLYSYERLLPLYGKYIEARNK